MTRALVIGVLALGFCLLCQPVFAGQGAGQSPKCGSMPRPSQALHRVMVKAQKLMAKDNAGAGRILAEYAKAHPKTAHCQFSFLRGVIAYQNKMTTQAERHFSKAVQLWPCYSAALSNLAVVVYEQGDPAKAAGLMIKAYESDKKSQPGFLYQAAAFYLAAGQPSQALPLLLRLAEKPEAKAAWLKALVRAYMELKRFREAGTALARLLATKPGDAELWRLSASLNLGRGDHAQAAADLELAYRLSPPARERWKTLAELYRMAGAPRKAAGYFLRSFGHKPSAKQLMLLAGVYWEANQADKALEAARASIKLKPTANSWRFMAQVQMQNKKYAQAMQAYEEAAGLAPRNARYKLMAGYCALQMEEYQQALDHLSQAMARAKPGSRDAKEAERAIDSLKQYLKAKQEDERHGFERG